MFISVLSVPEIFIRHCTLLVNDNNNNHKLSINPQRMSVITWKLGERLRTKAGFITWTAKNNLEKKVKKGA